MHDLEYLKYKEYLKKNASAVQNKFYILFISTESDSIILFV